MRLLSTHFFVLSLAAGGPALISRTEAWPITIQSIQSTHKQNSRYKQDNEHSEKFTIPEMPIHNTNGLQAPNIYSYQYEAGKQPGNRVQEAFYCRPFVTVKYQYSILETITS